MITSPDNEKLKLVRKLAERRWRAKEGAFVTEGEDLLAAGVAAGAEPIAVLVAPDSGIEGEEVEADLFDSVSTLGSGTRVIGIWPIPGASGARFGVHGRDPGGKPQNDIGQAGVWVYLHGVGDPGNVGTIVRSAEAFGAEGVLCGPDCADPYGPKAVRASAGSIFNVTVLNAGLAVSPSPRVAMVASGGKDVAGAAGLLGDGAGTICLGAEREGLPAGLVEECDEAVTIPTRPGVDSLNVAIAAAIVLERIHSTAVGGASDG